MTMTPPAFKDRAEQTIKVGLPGRKRPNFRPLYYSKLMQPRRRPVDHAGNIGIGLVRPGKVAQGVRALPNRASIEAVEGGWLEW